jgi:hypothetical protein
MSGSVWWRAAMLAAPKLLVILTELLIRVATAILNDVFPSMDLRVSGPQTGFWTRAVDQTVQ